MRWVAPCHLVLVLASLMAACKKNSIETAPPAAKSAESAKSEAPPGASVAPAPSPLASASELASAKPAAKSASDLAIDGAPEDTFGPPDRFKVSGYPAVVSTEMGEDAPTIAGFSADGEVLGYDAPNGGKGGDFVEVLFRDSHKKTYEFDSLEAAPSQVSAWVKAWSTLKPTKEKDSNGHTGVLPPALAAIDVAFVRDFTFSVLTSKEAICKGDTCSTSVSFGGKYKTEAMVYPLAVYLTGKAQVGLGRIAYLGLSPDGSELGMIGDAFCGDNCEVQGLTRMAWPKVLSEILINEGLQHHKKKEYKDSLELFRLATILWQKEARGAYNMACAYALLKDEKHAEAALRLALKIGGAPLKKQVQADNDFKEVRDTDWFKAVMNP